jgi:diguanylate cyclase (GGDEF)-like protein
MQRQPDRECRLAVEQAERAANERLRSAAGGAESLLAAQALHDGLTGLPNRRAFDERLRGFLARGRDPRLLALADVDHFKAVNDRHSHLVGDEVLRRLGSLLRSGVRDLDFAARIGGEEFALLFVGVDADCALAACERLRELVATQDWAALAPGLHVTLSMGLALVRPGEMAGRDGTCRPGALWREGSGAQLRAGRAGRQAFQTAVASFRDPRHRC